MREPRGWDRDDDHEGWITDHEGREAHDRDREAHGVAVWGSEPGEDLGPAPQTPQLWSWVAAMRFAETSTRTLQQKLDYAYFAAYGLDSGPWRTVNIAFFYIIVVPGHTWCEFAKWAYFDKLSRFLIAVPVTAFAVFCLNHIPLVQWAVPDVFDVSTLWSEPADTVTVSVPIEGGVG